MHSAITTIVETFRARGDGAYGAEAVNQRQHALQSATLASAEGADEHLVAAALLHDLGHLLSEDALPSSVDENLDDAHEHRAYAWLKKHFGRAVADPVRLHVAAKRYLCTVEPGYADTLSPTSLKSFHDQGGTMSDEEREAFEAELFFEQAVALRRWDDRAKEPEQQTEPLEHFVPLLERVLS
ncbi:MAG: metal-dependent phosphohydrolase [Planctomycetales bacterium]|nr:metal-dependent phosphohydrolase [Planctomycetales bacterium]